MKPPRFSMEYKKKVDNQPEMLAASSSGFSRNPPDMTTPDSDVTTQSDTAHSQQSRESSQVTKEKVANATAHLKQLLRKQTLAYQSHIMDVIRSGDVSELKRFLEQKEGKLNVNFFDKEGQTALHQSCLEGNVELVKVLVKYGADTRLANRDGWNPLHVATFGGHKDIVMFLVSLHSR